jgi:hypothetical protein
MKVLIYYVLSMKKLKILIFKLPSTNKIKKSIFHPLASIFVKRISIAFICIFKNILQCLFNMWFFIIIVIKSNNMFILISERNDLLKFNTSTQGRTTFHYVRKDHEYII